MTNKQRLIKQIISQAEREKPEKVVLFGSLASGQFKKGSDIDLLIIKNTKEKPIDRYIKFRLLFDLEYPFDLFVLTEEELNRRLKTSFFFREILEKGKVIYEKKH